MGSENDKRLKDLAKEAPEVKPPEELTKSQSAPAQQRMNPYDQRANSPPNNKSSAKLQQSK